jgi:hypothetical protein
MTGQVLATVSLKYDSEAPIVFTMPASISLAVALSAFNNIMSLSYEITSDIPLPDVPYLDCTNSKSDDEAYVAETVCMMDSDMYSLHWRKMPPGDLSEIENIYNTLFYLIGL